MKVVKTRAFRDRLKGHHDGIIEINAPFGAESNLLLTISREGIHTIF